MRVVAFVRRKARKQALKVDNAIMVLNLIKVAKTATKEKVVRVAIMALKNILIGSADSGTDDAKKASTTSSTVGEEANKIATKKTSAMANETKMTKKTTSSARLRKPASNENRSKKFAKTSPTEVSKTPSSWTT